LLIGRKIYNQVIWWANCTRFEVFTVVKLRISLFWDVILQHWDSSGLLPSSSRLQQFGTANPVTQNHMSEEHSPQLYEVS